MRRQREDGARSRAAILEAAARLATVEGLDGLSIGRLAEHVGMSKSGLFAHFGSKEELQLATIDTASEIFAEEVVSPALAAALGAEARGSALRAVPVARRAERLSRRLLLLVDRRRDGYQAGPRTESGRRDRRRVARAPWRRQIAEAQSEGDIEPAEDPEQLAFELNALLLLGNAQYVISGGRAGPERARLGIERRLALARTQPASA